MSSNPPPLPPFLTLPTEIRLKIYALVIPHSLRLRFKPHRRTVKNGNRTWRQTAHRSLTPLTASRNNKISLLLTSRLLHRESAPLFYGSNTFILEVDQYSFTSVLRHHVLGYMRDVEIKDLNFGRGSGWYQARLSQIIMGDILRPLEAGGGNRTVFSGMKRLTLQLEGTDAFASVRGRGLLVRMLSEVGAGKLDCMVVVCRGGKGVMVRSLVDVWLGAGWVRGGEEVGKVLWWRGRLREGVRVCWAKEKSGKIVGGVGEGLEVGLRGVRL